MTPAPPPTPEGAARALHRRLFRSGQGQISEDEAVALATVVRRRRPRRVLEVGVASGLSTLVLHTALAATQGRSEDTPRLLALDLDARFYADETKPTGWLIREEHAGAIPADVRLVTGVTTVDLADLPEVTAGPAFDLAFIDADHKHPWPTLDALLTWPHLAEDGVLLCHDLSLFRKARSARGVGPKLLCDQIPAEVRIHPADDGDTLLGDNLFGLVKAIPDRAFAGRLADALLLPWTVRRLPEEALSARITARLAAAYPGTPVADAFTEGRRRAQAMRDGTG